MNIRNQYFDFLRGIAIVMVIAIHTFKTQEFSSISGLLSIGIRQLLNIAVPLFLAISGFFVGKKTLETKEERFCFWKKQIPKVYIPVLVWSFPYLAISVYGGKNLLLSLILYAACGFSIYYFVALIIQCYLLLPVLQKQTNIKMGGVLTCLSLCCVTAIEYFGLNKLPLIVYAGLVIVWLVFFWLGIYLSGKKRSYNIGWISYCAVISFALMIIETYYRHKATGGAFGIKPSSFLFSLFMILILFSEKIEARYKNDSFFNKCITIIGHYSFPMYLIHCYVISFAFHFINIPFWFVRWLIVLGISMLITYLAKKILPKKILKIIGFC